MNECQGLTRIKGVCVYVYLIQEKQQKFSSRVTVKHTWNILNKPGKVLESIIVHKN